MSDLRVFYDCEFSDLAPDAALISIGFVCGSEALYVELTDGWEAGQCSYFVEDRVLPLLGKHSPEKLDSAAAAVRIQEWLDGLRDGDKSRQIVMSSDSVYDWEFLKEIFWDVASVPWARRKNIVGRLVQHELPAEICAQLEAYYAKGFPDQHHALVDARKLQFLVQSLPLVQPATGNEPKVLTKVDSLLAADRGVLPCEDDEFLSGRNKLLSENEGRK